MAKKDRNGKRRGREYSKRRVPDLGYYFVVTDTKATEENYLIGLRDSLPERLQGRIVINDKSYDLDFICQVLQTNEIRRQIQENG